MKSESPKIFLYSQPGCKSCLKLKKLLKTSSFSYKEINVFEHKEMWESIRKGEQEIIYTPTLGVYIPQKQQIIYIAAGRDFEKEEEGIDKLKYYFNTY